MGCFELPRPILVSRRRRRGAFRLPGAPDRQPHLGRDFHAGGFAHPSACEELAAFRCDLRSDCPPRDGSHRRPARPCDHASRTRRLSRQSVCRAHRLLRNPRRLGRLPLPLRNQARRGSLNCLVSLLFLVPKGAIVVPSLGHHGDRVTRYHAIGNPARLGGPPRNELFARPSAPTYDFFNRHIPELESPLNYRKQRTGPISNRHKIAFFKFPTHSPFIRLFHFSYPAFGGHAGNPEPISGIMVLARKEPQCPSTNTFATIAR